MALRYAIHIHCFGAYADPRVLVALVREAEDAGWDGVFVNDHLGARSNSVPQPVANPWIVLAAMAAATQRVKLGPMVTPLPRRRPWQVASEAVTLDHLSGGRLILGVGSGTSVERSFAPYGEAPSLKVRAAMLDEALDVLAGLWSGEPVTYRGRHYQLDGAVSLPRPVQQPRIPIWIAGHWPHRRPFDRAARWDGMFVDAAGVNWLRREIVPADTLADCVRYTRAQRPSFAPFDVVIGGFSPNDPAAAADRLAPYAAAGLTWWVEGIRDGIESPDALRAKIRRGPPRA